MRLWEAQQEKLQKDHEEELTQFERWIEVREAKWDNLWAAENSFHKRNGSPAPLCDFK